MAHIRRHAVTPFEVEDAAGHAHVTVTAYEMNAAERRRYAPQIDRRSEVQIRSGGGRLVCHSGGPRANAARARSGPAGREPQTVVRPEGSEDRSESTRTAHGTGQGKRHSRHFDSHTGRGFGACPTHRRPDGRRLPDRAQARHPRGPRKNRLKEESGRPRGRPRVWTPWTPSHTPRRTRG